MRLGITKSVSGGLRFWGSFTKAELAAVDLDLLAVMVKEHDDPREMADAMLLLQLIVRRLIRQSRSK